jgi:hypothetical protein
VVVLRERGAGVDLDDGERDALSVNRPCEKARKQLLRPDRIEIVESAHGASLSRRLRDDALCPF